MSLGVALLAFSSDNARNELEVCVGCLLSLLGVSIFLQDFFLATICHSSSSAADETLSLLGVLLRLSNSSQRVKSASMVSALACPPSDDGTSRGGESMLKWTCAAFIYRSCTVPCSTWLSGWEPCSSDSQHASLRTERADTEGEQVDVISMNLNSGELGC